MKTVWTFTFLLFCIISYAQDRYVDPAGLCGGNMPCYTTIQDAIDAAAPGDVIDVMEGIYILTSNIDVDKSVTINGPQADVDPRPSAGSSRIAGSPTEAIVNGNGISNGIFDIDASDVIINGLEIRNADDDLIFSGSGSGLSNVQIKYNIIHDALDDEGIQLRDVSNGLVEYNFLFDIAQDAINMCCGSNNSIIQLNEITESSSSNGSIYVYDMGSGMQILDNLLYGNTINDAIKLGIQGGDNAGFSSNAIISCNTIRDPAQDGISVYTSDVTVSNNMISGSNSVNGAIYLINSPAAGQVVSNVTIVDNIIENNPNATTAIEIGEDVIANTVMISNNSIQGNAFGVTNSAFGVSGLTVDAENNWWGDASGPSGQGPGTGDAVSTGVDFDPFLMAPPVIVSPCVMAAPVTADIPTMSQWATLLFGLSLFTLALVVVYNIKRVAACNNV